MKLKIKKGDLVKIIAGNHKHDDVARRVIEVYPKEMRILVEGVNVRKKHTKPNPKNQKGGIISKEMPVHYSNVMLIDSEKNPTRIGIRHELRDGKKMPVRYAKTNNKDI